MRDVMLFVAGVLCAPWLYIGACAVIVRVLRRRRLRQEITEGRREYELAEPIWNAAMHAAANEGEKALEAERDAA